MKRWLVSSSVMLFVLDQVEVGQEELVGEVTSGSYIGMSNSG